MRETDVPEPLRRAAFFFSDHNGDLFSWPDFVRAFVQSDTKTQVRVLEVISDHYWDEGVVIEWLEWLLPEQGKALRLKWLVHHKAHCLQTPVGLTGSVGSRS